jgi:hypothetical protein
MNIMDLFRGPAVPQNPNPGVAPVNPAPTGNSAPNTPTPGTVANPGTAPNGVVPVEGSGNPDNKANPSPFDGFEKLWETPANTTPNDTSPFATLDPAKVMESARKVDFSKAVTPEILAKIQAGGAEGVQAMMTAMTAVAQQGYGQSALATTKIVEQALKHQKTQFEAQLPSLVKKLSVSDNLRTENPLLSNPAIAPMVDALQGALLLKNPNATPTEIQGQVNDFLGAMGKAFGPKPVETAASKAAKNETDWDKFL